MCALAELLHNSGITVSGSDGNDVFYTDAILNELGIPFRESFSADHIPDDTDLVIHSAAYSPDSNPELREAQRRGIPILKYTDALGAYSARFDSSGIAGVHGKTTTTALAGTLIRGAGLPAQVLAGSAVSGFGGRSTLNLGDRYFVAETCEYRRHFLSFHPRRIVLTSVESDHQDYFPTYESIRNAFLEYTAKLPPGGELIYCADDPGASEVAAASAASADRAGRSITVTPYGFTAEGLFRIEDYRIAGERMVMKLRGFPGELCLRVPGRHLALDAAAALALTSSLVRAEFGSTGNGCGVTGDSNCVTGNAEDNDASNDDRIANADSGTADYTSGWTPDRYEKVRTALEDFRGSKRRSEIIGERGGILFMDDYGHHPTAIKTTLEGLKEFYPNRRLVLSFMSHTYTRTAALLNEFAASFEKADVVFLHKIYASAREAYHGGVNGQTLFERTKALRTVQPDTVYYVEEPEDAAALLQTMLRPGDLFITMGAGDNWKLGKCLLEYSKQVLSKQVSLKQDDTQ
ncbi:UDP-N-acetylmuramate--L-alanine ligase [Spirochaetia bacterium]|nr:UDP-N-acetylmuramate--L-alanine ligase [Spirochaetia bacterium]